MGGSRFTSKPFEFRVEDAHFFVHLDLLAEHSQPLHTLATIDMKEKEQGYAELQGVTAETFSRFLEWIYGGSYTLPAPKQVTVTEDGKQLEQPLQTNVYLALTKLYAFAQERDVQALKSRALADLHKTHSAAANIRSRFDIATILRYVYENTTPASGKDLEPLRAFAMNNFCDIFSLTQLIEGCGIESVIREDADFMKDYMWMLAKRQPPIS